MMIIIIIIEIMWAEKLTSGGKTEKQISHSSAGAFFAFYNERKDSNDFESAFALQEVPDNCYLLTVAIGRLIERVDHMGALEKLLRVSIEVFL